MDRSALIIDCLRSPRGKGKESGSLHDVHPQRVLAQVLNALRDRHELDTADVDDVIMGCASQSGDHAMDIARVAALDAGWSLEATGVTLNRHCGSGQQAISFAAMAIQAGHQDLVVAGGVESMSRYAPLHVDGFQANNPHVWEQYPMVPQGVSADVLASLHGFSRRDCDQIAFDSQQRAAVAVEEGRFERSIVPIVHDDGSLALDHDEIVRPNTTSEELARLQPSFADIGTFTIPATGRTVDETMLGYFSGLGAVDHVHHAGNSSGVVDGASAVLLASPMMAARYGWMPRGRVVMSYVAGSDPVLMFTAPPVAVERCLDRAGMSLSDIDLFEVNEAFASVIGYFLQESGVSWEKVNVNGGAIALGHPIGATGGMLLATLVDELERRDLSTGMVTMCTGGGMATATIIERV